MLVNMTNIYIYFFRSLIKVIFRGKNNRSITNNDHLALSFSDTNNELNRFIISNKQAGWISAFNITDDPDDIPKPAPQIQGHWLLTPQGYNIELRVPLKTLGDKIAFAFFDVDSPGGEVTSAIGSADPSKLNSLGTILVPSPEIERIVKGMRYTNSSIWVVDQHHRVLASAGSLKSASGVWQTKTDPLNDQEEKSLWYRFKQHLLLPLYYNTD